VIPARFTALDKINRYGGKIEDPFKVNLTIKQSEVDERVFTSAEHQADLSKKKKAAEQIKATFENVKKIQVGMEKPDSDGRVKAMKVFDIIPSFQALPHQILHVINEDIGTIDENLGEGVDKQKFHVNNGQLLLHYQDVADKKFALYRHDHSTKLPDDLAKLTLGKRAAASRPDDLNQAVQYEHVRNYCYSQIPNETKDEFIIQLDKTNNLVRY
jgi:hypothetical protein